MNFLKRIFKRKLIKEGLYNIHHPEMSGKTEFAFECGGVNYYRAVKDYFLPVGRFKFIDEKLSEAEIRMNLATLKGFIKELKKSLDGSKGTVDIGKAWETIYKMETRCNLAFEPETVRQLAAVVFFDETEDLRDFDKDYAQKKLSLWDSHDSYAFFLTRPMAELLNVNGSSEEYLRKYITQAKLILEGRISELENQSLENS